MRIDAHADFTLPAIDGIHLPDGRVFANCSATAAEFRVAEEPQTAAGEDRGGATLYPGFEVTSADGRSMLVGGEGAWEGEGFLALLDASTREVVWVLYSQYHEGFVAAEFSPHGISARSGGYPVIHEWIFTDAVPPAVGVARAHV